MFCEGIPRFANLFGITTNVENSDRVPLFSFIIFFCFFNFSVIFYAALGALRSIGKAESIYAIALGLHSDLNVGTQIRIHKFTLSYDIYPHKSLVYMLITDKSWLITHNYR